MTDKELEALKSVTVHLIAAVSLLEENYRIMAPTKRDPFHNTRMGDFKRSIAKGRAAWKGE